jgi:hypothetical protein
MIIASPIKNIELTKKGLDFIINNGRNTLDEIVKKEGRCFLECKGYIKEISWYKIFQAHDL